MLTSHIRRLLTACLLMLGALVSPLGGGVAVARPTANFDWAPKPVVAGTPVTFTSTSTPFREPWTPITKTEWTIEGAGTFEGDQVTVTAPAAGPWNVRLHVSDMTGEAGEVTKQINVEPPPPPPPANRLPTPAIAVLPASPLVGEEVTFISYSEDPDGHITDHAWDVNGDGTFDEAGAVVTRRFGTPGDQKVTLRVKDDKGASATVSRMLVVRQPAARPPSPSTPVAPPLPRLLSPFPVVRLVGSLVSGGAVVRMLAVRAPAGALVLVRCHGAGCPVNRVKKVAGKVRLRFGVLERRLPSGVVLEVLVRGGDRIGKYTSFRIRRNRFPQRTDACLRPGTTRRVACPKS
jgi:hypothetical protein